jgi:IPT/TIG domain
MDVVSHSNSDEHVCVGGDFHLAVPIDHGFDVLDGNTGKLRERVSLPAVISSGGPPGAMGSVDTLLVDSTGQNVVMVSTTGVIFVQLDEIPLGIGSLLPSFGGAGTSVTVRGSGFTGATTVSFNATLASASYIDPDTLHVTVPPGASGAAQVSVANSNGES